MNRVQKWYTTQSSVPLSKLPNPRSHPPQLLAPAPTPPPSLHTPPQQVQTLPPDSTPQVLLPPVLLPPWVVQPVTRLRRRRRWLRDWQNERLRLPELLCLICWSERGKVDIRGEGRQDKMRRGMQRRVEVMGSDVFVVLLFTLQWIEIHVLLVLLFL